MIRTVWCNGTMQMLGPDDLYRLAATLVEEHGPSALDYARRAVIALEADGEVDRARFWLTMCLFLDDLVEYRHDGETAVTLH
jgi:hypothetical protein